MKDEASLDRRLPSIVFNRLFHRQINLVDVKTLSMSYWIELKMMYAWPILEDDQPESWENVDITKSLINPKDPKGSFALGDNDFILFCLR